jgi:hypothetical protein
MCIMTRSIVLLTLFAAPAVASGPPELITKLNKTVTLKEPIDAGLDLFLTEFAEQHGLTGKILLDAPAFKATGVENVRESMVKLDKLTDVKASTVLDAILKQVDGCYFVKDTHIVITTKLARRAMLGEKDEDDAPVRDAVPLVRMTFTETPIRKALEELADKFDASILLAPYVAEKGDALVTAKLVNVPLDHAVELLADMADLSVVKRGNALYVTIPGRAKELGK